MVDSSASHEMSLTAGRGAPMGAVRCELATAAAGDRRGSCRDACLPLRGGRRRGLEQHDDCADQDHQQRHHQDGHDGKARPLAGPSRSDGDIADVRAQETWLHRWRLGLRWTRRGRRRHRPPAPRASRRERRHVAATIGQYQSQNISRRRTSPPNGSTLPRHGSSHSPEP